MSHTDCNIVLNVKTQFYVVWQAAGIEFLALRILNPNRILIRQSDTLDALNVWDMFDFNLSLFRFQTTNTKLAELADC